MTKTIAIIAILCASFTAAIAQQNHLKMYFGFELANRPELQLSKTDNTSAFYSSSYYTQSIFAIGFAHEKTNGHFWEFSGQSNAYIGYQAVNDYTGMPDSFPFPGQYGKQRNNFAQIQYEYNFLQGGVGDRRIKTYLGLFLRANSQWASYRPGTATYYPVQHWSTSISPGFVPRVRLKSSERWSIEVSAPIVLAYFGYEQNTVENPALSKSQQRSSLLDINMLNLETQLRIGFSYALNKPAASAE